MSYLKLHEPKDLDFCLCGSGLPFRICCKGKYASQDSREIEALLEADRGEEALQKVRRQICWYRLAHKAHTAPLVKTASKPILKLLSIDIDAMEELSDLVCRCLVHVGAIQQIETLLTSIEHAIDDQRWNEAHFILRLDYLWKIRYDRAATWILLNTSPHFATTTRDAPLMAWLSVAPEGISIEQKLNVLTRLRRNTRRSDIMLHCDLIESAVYIGTLGKRDAGVEILRKGLSKARIASVQGKNAFGAFKFMQALALLGRITVDQGLLEESIQQAQGCLKMSEEFSKEVGSLILTDCGESCISLNQPARAISFLEAALKEDPITPLPHIYIARAEILHGRLDRARQVLMETNPLIKSAANKLDYAYVAAELALKSKVPEDIEYARNWLNTCKGAAGVFEVYRQDYIARLAGAKISERTIIRPFWRSLLTRYIMLEPNMAGMGIRLNAIIEDATKAHKNSCIKATH